MARKPTLAECDALLTQPGTTFEIEEIELDGRLQKVWKHTSPDFRTFLTQKFARFAGRILVSSPAPEPAPLEARERLTYAEVYRRAVSLAGWLREKGARCGTRVGIGAGNCSGWVVSFVAVHLLGAVPVILNATLQPEMQIHCLEITQPKILLVDTRRAVALAPFARELRQKGITEIYCWSGLAHLSPSERVGIKEIGHIDPSPQAVRDVELGTGTEALTPDSDSMIMFTSGTTSQPKAVRLTQRGSLSHMRSTTIPGCRAALRQGADLATALSRFDPPPTQQSYLVAVPLFHVTGCLSWLVRALNLGSKVVFMRRWNVRDAIELIKEETVNVIGGVPAIVTSILQSPHLPPDHPITNVSFGGAPPPRGLAKQVVEHWPKASVVNGYGMTETNGIVTSLVGQDYIENPACVGRPSPIVEVRIIDPETKEELPAGQTGLLVCRGSMVMREYVGNPQATAEAIGADGWFDTGDLAMMDEHGWIFIQDRAKDMIIRGGENIASAEVEHAICLDERIAHAAAVPVPDEIMGERVGVAVTLAPGKSATPQSIIAAVEGRLRYAARPAIVVIIESMPRNASGKVLKLDVRKIVQNEWARQHSKARL